MVGMKRESLKQHEPKEPGPPHKPATFPAYHGREKPHDNGSRSKTNALPPTAAFKQLNASNNMKDMTSAIEAHLAKISDEARADYAARQIDEVMTDALYRDCEADTKEEMEEALEIAISICRK